MKTARQAYDETTRLLPCTCGTMYESRKMIAPDCVQCNYLEDIRELMEAYANDKLSQFTQRQELAVAAHDNHVKIIKQLEASMALESSKCIQSLEMKDERIKDLEKLVVIMHVEKHPHLTPEQEIIIKQL